MDANQDQGWHIKKEVSVGHLLTTGSAIFAVLYWANTVEARLAKIPSDADARLAVLENQQTTNGQNLGEIKDSLRRIEDKLDRKVDKE